MQRTLNDLNEGEKGSVEDISLRGDMLRRLLDIGICRGTIVECIGKSPHGDPKAFLIRGAVVALRSEVSKSIFIKGAKS